MPPSGQPDQHRVALSRATVRAASEVSLRLERDGRVTITDLRMGQEPYYSFNFVVGQRQSPTIAPIPPTLFREQHDVREGLSWVWRRALGQDLPPPR